MSSHQEKALRYIANLDSARCNRQWQDVPELVRKVRKHAPERKCLTLTAETEHKVVVHESNSTANTTSNATVDLSDLLPPLRDSIAEEAPAWTDVVQAQVCLAWINWIQGDRDLAVSSLPPDFGIVIANAEKEEVKPSGWVTVCLLKGAFIKGTVEEESSHVDDALGTYESVLSLVPIGPSPISPQLKLWSEKLLAHLCLAANQTANLDLNKNVRVLRFFRIWADFCEGRNPDPSDTCWFDVWKEYYEFLSMLLQNNLPYPFTSPEGETDITGTDGITPKLDQATELKRVQTIYEKLLLKKTRFPRANESNLEVEEWTNMVMANWKVICGPNWHDDDLGDGGQNAAAKDVLDILYRAATKTFHSPTILRHLFTVHAYLAEFDLAFKAFDTYMEIITTGRARAEKSEEHDPDLEDDNNVLKTQSEAIRILCQFGGAIRAAKAKDIGVAIEDWLVKHPPRSVSNATNGDHVSGLTNGDVTSHLRYPSVSPKTLAIAYRAIGISQAQWARVTFDPAVRAEFQKKAVKSLQTAVSPEYGDQGNLETLYALGLLLAERRDLTQGLQILRKAVEPSRRRPFPRDADGIISEEDDWDYSEEDEVARERKLIPIWHLIALLLSARQDFESAEKSCEAAFEQFTSFAARFGHNRKLSVGHGDVSLNVIRDRQNVATTFENFFFLDKQRALEIRMTQLALVEVMEGPETAVNLSEELLALFARLFKGVQTEHPREEKTHTLVPPKSSAGTIKSMAGSFFGRRKFSHSAMPAQTAIQPVPRRSLSGKSHRPTTSVTISPAIHVTDEQGKHENIRTNGRARSGSRKLRKSIDGRRSLDDSNTWDLSDRRPQSAHSMKSSHPKADGGIPSLDDVGIAISSNISSPPRPSTSGHDRSPPTSQSLRHVQHNIPYKRYPPTVGYKDQLPRQDTRLPAAPMFSLLTSPETRFSKTQEQKHILGILIKVWLVIAGLYRRASMLDDALGACDEVQTLVGRVEAIVAARESSARAFAAVEWGDEKSVNEHWADFYTERGRLAMAKSNPYEALDYFEQALVHYQDHPAAIVGVCNILLDIYTEAIPPEPPIPDPIMKLAAMDVPSEDPILSSNLPSAMQNGSATVPNESMKYLDASSSITPTRHRKTPESLNRLAARDRAYGLLNTLTKLGSGWDDSEAWFTLARAYEESGQIQKAKEVLWWCVELEDGRPIRHWRNINGGGFVL